MSTKRNILLRILIFPFFAGLALIAAIFLWFKYMVNFARYGGEAIAYTEKNTPIMIKHLYDKMVETNKSNFQ